MSRYLAVFSWCICSVALNLGIGWGANAQTTNAVTKTDRTVPLKSVAAGPLQDELTPSGGLTRSSSRSGGAANLNVAAPLGCLIEASSTIEVGSPVIGVLESVSVDRGDSIRKGQVLAQFESRVERANLALAELRSKSQADMLSARAQKQYALKKAHRAAELTELRYVSSQAREQADAEATVADMKLSQTLEQRALNSQELLLARAQLAQRTIISPLSGVVVDRYAFAGERIENRPLMKIAQIDPLRVEVVLPAARFNTMKIGARAKVIPDSPGVSAQNASVSVIDRVVDAASNTFRIRLNLPNKAQTIPAGVRCKIEFDS